MEPVAPRPRAAQPPEVDIAEEPERVLARLKGLKVVQPLLAELIYMYTGCSCSR